MAASCASGRMPHHEHARRIAAVLGDVLVHPAHRLRDVADDVAHLDGRQQPVVHRDEHEACVRERPRLLCHLALVAGLPAAAVNPEDHGQAPSRPPARGRRAPAVRAPARHRGCCGSPAAPRPHRRRLAEPPRTTPGRTRPTGCPMRTYPTQPARKDARQNAQRRNGLRMRTRARMFDATGIFVSGPTSRGRFTTVIVND